MEKQLSDHIMERLRRTTTMSNQPVQRFDIPSKPTIIEGFRAMRSYFEKVAASKGEKLDPAWYDDGPDRRPNLYKDQPELIAAASAQMEKAAE
jgi:hypothetical protein